VNGSDAERLRAQEAESLYADLRRKAYALAYDLAWEACPEGKLSELPGDPSRCEYAARFAARRLGKHAKTILPRRRS
jgi:hypothetical protein